MKKLITAILLLVSSFVFAQQVQVYYQANTLVIHYIGGTTTNYYSSNVDYSVVEIDTTHIAIYQIDGNESFNILRPTPDSLIVDSDTVIVGNNHSEVVDYLRSTIQAVQTDLQNQVIVNQDNYSTVLQNIDPNNEYFIDGTIYLNGTTINAVSGINLKGYDYNTSVLIDTTDNYTMITGGGNILIENMSMTTSGTGSKVFDITGTTIEAVEMNKINFISCTSLGEITDYRQALEDGTGRFGGTPELTMSGTWNGYRITTSIVRGSGNMTALFRKGTNLALSGRFITDLNCDLPATGALLDFDTSNIINDESLIIDGAFITRQGVLNTDDPNITPNITSFDIKSKWSNNTGIKNTNKYLKASVTAEVATTILAIDTYYPILGTWDVTDSSHFQSPSNGVYELLSGNGSYQITGEIILVSTANNELDIRVTLSTDGGSTFPTEINHIKRVVNNLSGGRDVAFFPINFIANIKDGEMIRFEVENKTAANNVTAEIDSYIIISQL